MPELSTFCHNYQTRQARLQPDQYKRQSPPPSLRHCSIPRSIASLLVGALAVAESPSPAITAAHLFIKVRHILHFPPPRFLPSEIAPFLAFRLARNTVV